MRAVYDLRAQPATHDFCNFLAYAELDRRAMRDDQLNIDIVRGRGMRNVTVRDVSLSYERRWFAARDLLPQLAWLVPSVRSVNFIDDADSTHHYKNLKEPPGVIFEASSYARSEVARFLEGIANPVSISLRASRFEPSRNSDVAEWLQVANWLSNNGYTPIIVPDLRDAVNWPIDRRWARFEQFPAGAIHADFCLALYEQCLTNLMVNFGRMLLCLMGKARVIACKIASETVLHHSDAMLAGFKPEVNWGEGKHTIWAPDHAEIIIPELEKRLATLSPVPLASQEPAQLARRLAAC